jgi:4-amino-4-deoxy-L-arabinose transferase-like glycosyltransferase
MALNMLATGDYLVPHIDDEHPHYAKPPLIYWAIAGSITAFGRSE